MEHEPPQQEFEWAPSIFDRPWLLALRVAIGSLELAIALGALGALSTLLAGAFWPSELAAQFRVQWAAGLVAGTGVLLARRRFRVLVPYLALTLWIALPVARHAVGPRAGARSEGAGEALRIAVHNLWSGNRSYDAVRRWLEEQDADVIGLMEVTPRWQDELDALSATHPHAVWVPRDDNFGLALLSRWPLEAIERVDQGRWGLPNFVARVAAPFGTVGLVLTHPLPPMSPSRLDSRDALLAELGDRIAAAPEVPWILAGDLNLAPWSPRFERVLDRSGLVDTGRGFGLAPTWQVLPTALGGIAIDHVLCDPGFAVIDRTVGPANGSDHRPLVVELGWRGEAADSRDSSVESGRPVD